MNSSTENNWKLGEIAHLPSRKTRLKKSGSTLYDLHIGSRYICVREATPGQRGILVKILGKYKPERITTVSGQSFCKDNREKLFKGKRYLSYPFPTVMDVQKVIEILQCNPTLIQSVEKASMHINLKSKYWVKETKTRFLFMKKPQCYDVCSGQLSTPAKDEMPYRLTIVYFYKGYLVW